MWSSFKDSSAVSAALATPRRLGEKFAAAVTTNNTGGRERARWHRAAANAPATPLPEPMAHNDNCAVS